MPIRDLQQFAGLMHGGDPDGDQRRRMLVEHRESILARQAELGELLGIVDTKIARFTELRDAWSDPASLPPFDRSPTNGRSSI